MDSLNAILTLPGKLGAYFLSDHLRLFSILFFCLIIVLFVLELLYKKKEYLHIALILSSLLLAFIPFTFKFASYDSKLFWVFIALSATIGFVYYFIDKKNSGINASDDSENSTHENIPNSQEQPAIHPLDGITRFLRQNSWLILAIFIFILAFYLRTFQIEQYPAGYSTWELLTTLDLVKYTDGKLDLKTYLSPFQISQVAGANYSGALHSFIILGPAIPYYKIFGISLASVRYFSVLWGMAGLIFLFLYLRELFPTRTCVFLVSFTALELINVIFARTGFHYITAFTYTVFVLYLSEITFKLRNLYFSIPLAFILGLAVFGSNYVYLPAKAVMVIIILFLGYKILFRKGFIAQNAIPLIIFVLTFLLPLYVFTRGDVKAVWPIYPGYINIDQNHSLVKFFKGAFDLLGTNFNRTFDITVFSERGIDSLSKYKEGGLLSGPALCFIPFAMGYTLAGIRRERYFQLTTILLVTLLPAILGFPNARRLLLFLSLLLILSGITIYLLFNQIQRILTGRMKGFAALILAFFFLFIFSYNLYIFIDVNNNMLKRNPVRMPFAEAGIGDMTYSKYTTSLAKEIGEFVEHNNDVFFYYSSKFDENGTSPNGTYEQFLIESYNYSMKGGGKVAWMNPFPGYAFTVYDKLYFNKFETAIKMIQDSDRDVKVVFIKPLADEKIIYETLKAFFPRSVAEERTGDTTEDKYFILSISHNEIAQIDSRKLVFSKKILNDFDSETLSRLVYESTKTDFSLDEYFLLQNDTKILFKNDIASLFEIAIDDYKLTEQNKELSLLKGVHHVKITHTDRMLFSAIANHGKFKFFPAPMLTVSAVFYPHLWTVEKSTPYKYPYPIQSFYYNEDDQYIYANYNQLFNASDQLLISDNPHGINKILKKEDRTFIIQRDSMDHGYLTIFDSNNRKIKETPLDGYPFDFFFDDGGELYITYINRDKITIFHPDDVEETWDTSSFSEFPIWNGAVDKNGDIILLSGSGKVFIFYKNRTLYKSFDVDTSWAINDNDLIRSGGGIVITDGIIHILDSTENFIKSYNKSGQRLYYNSSEYSLFKIPPGFKINFMQRLNNKIILTGRGEKNESLVYQQEQNGIKVQEGILLSLSLLKLEPSDATVGYYKYSINSGPGLFQKVNNKKYSNFIFAHAPSHATYHLKGLFQSLSIGYGVDDNVGKGRGSVKFIIQGDGKLLYTSKVIHAFDPIENVKIDVKGIDNLELIVDPTEDGNAFDQSVWINPILQLHQ